MTRALVEPLAVVPAVVLRRLSNWITRLFRGTYGARSSLRLVIREAARQMLEAGMSQAAITVELERRVLDHPACVAHDRPSIVTGVSPSHMLSELVRHAVADVVPEVPIVGSPA